MALLNIRYATFFNRDRDAINTAFFEEPCFKMNAVHGNMDDAIMIFSDSLQVKNSAQKYIPFHNSRSFWENCGEDNVKPPAGASRMDPVLRLYHGCRVMLPTNENVQDGKANGSQAIFQKVVLKPEVVPRKVFIAPNVSVNSIFAREVAHVVLKHCNNRVQPSIFILESKRFSFKARILKPKVLRVKGSDREAITMRANQVPLLINNATTGHKLQGSGVDALFVHSWHYATNWVYVILSRVKTMKGLYLRMKLSGDLKKYRVPGALTRMLQHFGDRAPTYWSSNDYDRMFNTI